MIPAGLTTTGNPWCPEGMRTADDADRVLVRLLGFAEADPAVAGAAITGSRATGGGDAWSDIDLALGVTGPLGPAMERWTKRLYRDFAAVHHWDLPAGPAIYRVFLLPGWLEVDIAFAPETGFGPLGPNWRTVFGQTAELDQPEPPSAGTQAGRAWHHALHARACIERGRQWQAEHWISALRDQVLTLACLRLRYPDSYAKGAHLLPPELTVPLEAALVASLDQAELRRALGAAVAALAAEVERADPVLAIRLKPMLTELSALP